MAPVAVFRHFATNELSKDGFDGIALKVIIQGRKGHVGLFSHIYL